MILILKTVCMSQSVLSFCLVGQGIINVLHDSILNLSSYFTYCTKPAPRMANFAVRSRDSNFLNNR
jgi:hypothetical protein